MAKFNSHTAKAAAFKRSEKFNGRGRYIVAYRLDRKNAARHECYRAKTVKECAEYILRQHCTDRYYSIYDYNWQEMPKGETK